MFIIQTKNGYCNDYIPFNFIVGGKKKQNLTTQMITDACGTSRSYISLTKIGKRLAGRKILPKIASATGIKITVVLNWYLED